MAELKNIHLIASLLTDKQQKQIEAGASLVRRHTAITLKVKGADATTRKVVVQAVQTKLPAGGEYLSKKALIDRAKEFFAPFFPDWDVVVNATPYDGTPLDAVTPQWLEERFSETGTKQRDVTAEIGLPESTVSSWISGKRPMSLPVKAMFYFYFKLKQQSK